MADLANYLYRALYLLGLAIAPRVLSPDPATPASAAVALLIGVVGLGGVLAAAFWLKKELASREASIAAGLIWVSVAAAVGAAIYFTGPEAPLARGAAPLAIVVWPTLAATAAALAGRYMGANFKHKRTGAAALFIAGGIFVHADGAKNMGDRAFMWKTALDREPAHERAYREVVRKLVSQGKLDEASKRTDACLAVNPSACECLTAKITTPRSGATRGTRRWRQARRRRRSARRARPCAQRTPRRWPRQASWTRPSRRPTRRWR
ncbi:MAG: hypothetical protein R3F14_11965 [Polyangiaceae bacterium]